MLLSAQGTKKEFLDLSLNIHKEIHTSLSNSFKTYTDEFMQLQKNILTSTTNNMSNKEEEINLFIKKQMQKITNELDNYFKDYKALSMNLLDISNLLSKKLEILDLEATSIKNSIVNGVRDLDEGLASITKNFTNDYKWFLERIKEVLGVPLHPSIEQGRGGGGSLGLREGRVQERGEKMEGMPDV